jgi:TonB-dependent receptor
MKASPFAGSFTLVCRFAFALLASASAGLAQGSSTGTIEGRVFNPGTGEFIENARITIEGTSLETFTDTSGQYRITNVPAGAARVKAFRTGAAAQTQSVTVTPGQVHEQNFNLSGFDAKPDSSGPVRLDQFVVNTSKEMDGAAIAINTQRFAPNAMNVVAADEFGAVAIGNVGEVLKSVPGISIGLGGLGAAYTIAINGVPPDNVPVTIGGFNLANAASGTGRAVGVNQISINNTARVEVIYTPTPETTGSALAGSVNLVPRSAFERSNPIFNGTVALMMRDDERSLRATPGPLSKTSRKVNPSLDFAAVVPVNQRFGFTLSGSTLRVYAPQDFSQSTWRGASAATNGTTLPDTTPDKPYLTDYAVRDTAALQSRTTGGATIDYKLTRNDRLTFSYQYGLTVSEQDLRTLTYFVNRVLPGNFSLTSTRGFPGAGEVRLNNAADTLTDTLHMPSLSYWHAGPIWKTEAGVGFSRSFRRRTDLSEGYFNATQARRQGVTVSFDEIFYLRPGVITVTDGTTGQPVDPHALSSYTLDTATSSILEAMDFQRNAFANIRREMLWRIPVTLKAGVDVRHALKDTRVDTPNFTFVGANGIAGTADDNAGIVLDESFSQRPVPFGFPLTQRVSNEKLLALYRQRPGYFTVNEATSYTSAIVQSKHAEEMISSGYLRGDVHLLDGRLKLVGGIRAEQTNVKGEGQLIDPTRNYRRDASGRFIPGPNGRPLPIATTALETARLTNVDRGLKAEKEYLRWFPSINGAYNIREDLIARAGYYQSVGRPNFNQYAGSLTLPDTDVPPGPTNRITVNNAGIKAWSARTTKVSFEYYFEKVGLISVSAFRRDIENFFGNTVFTPTAEFLGLYGIDPATYGVYDVSTQYNLSSPVRMTGLDFNYKQALTFLPQWARGIQVFANGSALRTQGEAAANFAGFIPRTGNWGISLARPTYNLRMRWNYTGRQRRAIVATGRSIESGTYNWGSKRLLVDVSGEYYFHRKVAVFASLTNLGDAPVDVEIAGPSTPAPAQFRQRTSYGALWTFGLKSTF